MESKDDTRHLIRMLGAPIQNQLGDIDAGRTGGTAGLAIEAGLHHSLRIQIAVVLIGDDLEPAARTHVFRLKHIVDRADGVALGAGRAGFGQSLIVDMLREGPVADLDAGVEHPGRIEALLHLHEQVVELRAEHRLHIFGAHAAIPMLPTDRAAEAAQDRLVDLVIALHHLLEIVLIVHVEQRNDVGVPVPDMTENRDRHALPAEEFFQIPDEFADPFSRHHHVIDKVDRLLPGIESIERGIERLAGFPQLVALLRIEGDHGIGREPIAAADLRSYARPAARRSVPAPSASNSTRRVAAASAGMPCFARPIRLSVLASMTSNALGPNSSSCGTASPTSSKR